MFKKREEKEIEMNLFEMDSRWGGRFGFFFRPSEKTL